MAPLARSLLAVPLVLALAACGGGKETKASDVEARVSDQLVESGLEEKAADCFAGVIVDEVGADKIKDVDFSADEPPAGLEDELTAAAAKALSTCELDGETP